MSKVAIAELASILMEKHGLKRTEAELFIRQFVVVINESLKKDKIAKIKGLGTFKVQAVSARKSVDVNTGEAIVIGGRDKISFTADAVMRDIVNAPFAQFETVVVNDGVDFSSIDESSDIESAKAKEDNDVVSSSISDSQSGNLESPPLSIDTTQDNKRKLDVIDETKESLQVQDEQTNQTEIIANPVAQTHENIVEHHEDIELPSNSNITPDIVEEQTNNATADDVQVQSNEDVNRANVLNDKQIALLTKEKEELVSETQSLQQSISDYQRKVKVLAWSLTLFAIVVVAGLVYVGSLLQKSSNRIEHLVVQNDNLVAKLTQNNVTTSNTTSEQDSIKAVNDSLAMIVKQKAEVAAKADEMDKEMVAEAKKTDVIAENKTTKENNNKKLANLSPQNSYNKDPRVRTGAYVITGIAQTITAKDGQTLASISRTYLGAGMECYIEAVNGGSKTIKAGDKVKIPELKTKKSLKK